MQLRPIRIEKGAYDSDKGLGQEPKVPLARTRYVARKANTLGFGTEILHKLTCQRDVVSGGRALRTR